VNNNLSGPLQETNKAYIINVKIIGKYSKGTNKVANLMIYSHKTEKLPLKGSFSA